MSQVTIKKEGLLNLLAEFNDDIPFQTAMLSKLIKQLPTGYADMWLTEKFYSGPWGRPYYILRKADYMELYFGYLDDIYNYLINNFPNLSAYNFKRLVNGSMDIYEGFTVEKKGESL